MHDCASWMRDAEQSSCTFEESSRILTFVNEYADREDYCCASFRRESGERHTLKTYPFHLPACSVSTAEQNLEAGSLIGKTKE